jgi:hypothetical protein
MDSDVRRRFRWALAGYLLLAVGVVVALIVLADQQNSIEDQQDSNDAAQDALHAQQRVLAVAAGAYCAVDLQPEQAENAVIHAIAAGNPIHFPPDCLTIIRRIERADLGGGVTAQGDP